jgi:hypothetical protein
MGDRHRPAHRRRHGPGLSTPDRPTRDVGRQPTTGRRRHLASAVAAERHRPPTPGVAGAHARLGSAQHGLRDVGGGELEHSLPGWCHRSAASKDVLRVGAWYGNAFLMRLSGLVSHRRRRTLVSNGSGTSRGDRNRNTRLTRLRTMVPVSNVVVRIDPADNKQMAVVTDDSKVWCTRHSDPAPGRPR